MIAYYNSKKAEMYCPLNYYNWEEESPYRPSTFASISFFDDFLLVKMKTDETDLRRECTKMNEPCYEDSCMEFFFAPFGKFNGYVNIECNPNGVFLAEFGQSRENRVFLSEVTSILPTVYAKVEPTGWQLELIVSYTMIEDVFKKKFTKETADFYVDFFKCGDKTIHPHYQSFTKMGNLPPGFHNPDCFEKVEII